MGELNQLITSVKEMIKDGESAEKILKGLLTDLKAYVNSTEDNWIPVSERLPSVDEMLKSYVRNHYGSEFIVMIKGANTPTTLYRTLDGFWVDDKRDTYEVTAWQPLPEPWEVENDRR